MKQLSAKCGLSCVYTNHSIRVTGTTILSKSQYGSKQIMSVTGHKSVSSLAVYQRVSDAEKLNMGKSLSSALAEASTSVPLPSRPRTPSPSNSQVVKVSESAAAPTSPVQAPTVGLPGEGAFSLSHMDNDPLMLDQDIVCTNVGNSVGQLQTSTNLCGSVLQFNNCTIQNITVNIYSK